MNLCMNGNPVWVVRTSNRLDLIGSLGRFHICVVATPCFWISELIFSSYESPDRNRIFIHFGEDSCNKCHLNEQTRQNSSSLTSTDKVFSNLKGFFTSKNCVKAFTGAFSSVDGWFIRSPKIIDKSC